MSKLRHATVSAWQRDEEHGGYRAEMNGWELRVRWRPAEEYRRRGFTWTATRPGGPKLEAEGVYEEIELAMADAESVALPNSPEEPNVTEAHHG